LAEYCLFYRALLQKRLVILSILPTKATPLLEPLGATSTRNDFDPQPLRPATTWSHSASHFSQAASSRSELQRANAASPFLVCVEVTRDVTRQIWCLGPSNVTASRATSTDTKSVEQREPLLRTPRKDSQQWLAGVSWRTKVRCARKSNRVG